MTIGTDPLQIKLLTHQPLYTNTRTLPSGVLTLKLNIKITDNQVVGDLEAEMEMVGIMMETEAIIIRVLIFN